MTVSPVAGVSHFIGLSTDTKPTGTKITPGSTFKEEDTGFIYELGADGWFQAPMPILGTNGETVSVQYPFPVDGDSIYAKDIDPDLSDIGTFTGDILSLVDDYEVEITDTSATNPKTFMVKLKRPLKSNTVAFGSKTGNFSNVKIQLKDLAGTVRTVVDDSDNDTKFTSNVYQFTTNVFIDMVIEFHTADAVKISGMFVPKVQSRAISAIDGYVSETNTTEETLLADGVFTGGQVDTLNYGMALLAVFSDVASASGGLSIQFRSTPTSTWRASYAFTIAGGREKTFSIQPVRRFMRIVYTNGGTNQTAFDLQTILKPVYVKPSSHRIGDIVSVEDDAELVKAGLTGLSGRTNLMENVETIESTLSVNQALVHREGVNELFLQFTGDDTTLAVAASAGDTDIDVVDASAYSDVEPGTQIEINGERFHFHVKDIVVNNITLDRPLDQAHPIGTTVKSITTELVGVGTITSPLSYRISPPPDEIWQITRILINITDGTAMDDGKFGGMTALSNGVVIRANRNGVFQTGSIWKTNGDMALDMFDINYTDKAPAGQNGLRGRWTFTKAEFIVELNGATSDFAEILVQDDITDLVGYNIKAQGRVFGR
jgi:hypothetical protein